MTQRNKKSRQSGFGLVTVLSVALISTLLLTGLLAGVLNVYRTLGSNKSALNQKNSAEAGIDYAIAQLNRTEGGEEFNPEQGSTSPVTVTKDLTSITTMIPAVVSVINCSPPVSSLLFDPILSDTDEAGNTTEWSLFKQNGISYKKIVSTVSQSGRTEEITVIAKPVMPTSSEMTSPSPYFPLNTSALGTNTINVFDSVETRGYNSADGSEFPSSENPSKYLGGDLTAYKQINILGNDVKIGGSLSVPSSQASSNLSVTAPSSSSVEVSRYVTASGTTSPGSFDASNVFSLSSNPTFASTQSTPVLEKAESPPIGIAPPPATPAKTPTPNATSSDLVPGDNVVQSLKMTNSNPSAETRVFVENSTSSGNVLTIDGNVNNVLRPSNLQFWYSGKGSIDVNAMDVRATIYAPNATVNLTGKADGASFHGAIIAKNLNLKNIKFFVDRSVSVPGSSGSQNLQYDKNSLSKIRYKAVSYSRK